MTWESWIDGLKAAAEFGLTWLGQSSALLALGLMAGRSLRRSGPAVQSVAYRTTLVAVLVCPVASTLLARAGLDGVALRLPVEAPAVEPAPPPIPGPAPAVVAIEPDRVPKGLEEPTRWAGGVAEPSPAVAAPPAAVRRPSKVDRLAAGVVAGLAAWALGMLMLATRLAVGLRAMTRLRASAIPADSDTEAICHELAGRMKLAAPEVLRAPFLESPCVVGLRRPAILLPDDPDLALRDTFVHELAHLARRDVWWNLIRQLASALLWCQPLLWMLSRRIEVTAEEVCDDYVVQFGGDRSSYAGLLLDLAGRALPPSASTAVGMVSFRSLLSRRIVRILDSSRSLSTRAGTRSLLLMLLAGLAGTLGAGMLGVGGPRKAAAGPEDEKAPAGARSRTRTVTGRVVDLDGRPVAGADVTVARFRRAGIGHYGWDMDRKGLERAVADADGRFALGFEDLDPAAFETPTHQAVIGARVMVVATTEGGGPGWAALPKSAGNDRPLTLTVARDDVPIDGRLIDLEGRPVAGATVKVVLLYRPEGPGAIDRWRSKLARDFAGKERPASDNFPIANERALPGSEPALPAPVMSDAAGRFRIAGLGRDRLATLEVTGPASAFRRFEVVTRPMPAIVGRPLNDPGVIDSTYHGSNPTLVVDPSRPVEGVVRDLDSKKPIPYATITAENQAGGNFLITGLITTTTDADGRYRLIGLPKGKGNRIGVYPPADQPYFVTGGLDVPDGPGLGPVPLDIELKRGIWISGRITDARTGGPVPAEIHYAPYFSNENARGYANFRADQLSIPDRGELFYNDADGRFRVVGLPGRGLLAAKSVDRSYRLGVGAEALTVGPGRGPNRLEALPIYNQPRADDFQAVAEIDPPAHQAEFPRDLTLDPGPGLAVRLVDGEGQPVAGASAWGRYPGRLDDGNNDLWGNETRVVVDPKESKSVVFYQRDRKLAAVLTVKPGDESEPAVREVVLRPCPIVTGRLVDPAGRPTTGVISIRATDANDLRAVGSPREIKTGEDGRFRVDDLPPHFHYTIRAKDRGEDADPTGPPRFKNFDIARALALESGRVLDLGTFEVTRGRRVEVPKVASKDDDMVRGQVVGPDGQPVAGASVIASIARRPTPGDLWFDPWSKSPDDYMTRTADRDGRFEIPVRRTNRESTTVMAHAPGFGVGVHQDGRPIRLPAGDLPITGRLIDLEGRPVAGASVRLLRLRAILDDKDRRDAASRPGPYQFPREKSRPLAGEPILPGGVVTDATGRFRIAGLGLDVLATLRISGPTVALKQVDVLTRAMPRDDRDISRTARMSGIEETATYGAECTLVVQPTRPIEGVVRDLDTGEPIPGTTVAASTVGGAEGMIIDRLIRSEADAQGRYRLVGLPRGDGHRISVYPPIDRPYFINERLEVPSRPGLDAVPFDVGLKRGLWVTGRVLNAKTSEPVMAAVDYLPFLDNPHARGYANFRDVLMSVPTRRRYRTDADGRFKVVAMPGRGVVAARSDDLSFLVGFGSESIAKNDRGQLPVYDRIFTRLYQGIREVDVPEGAATAERDVPLDPGGTLDLRYVDEAGEPVKHVFTRGRFPNGADQGDLNYEETSGRVGGLEPGRPRTIVLTQNERKIGAVLELPADGPVDGRTVDVVLRPMATVVGRIVADKPLPPLAALSISTKQAGAADGLLAEIGISNVPLDPDGRFRFDGLPPGGSYKIQARDYLQGGRVIRPPNGFEPFEIAANLSPKAGQVVDLGTFDARTGKRVQDSAKKPEAKPLDVPITGRIVDLEGRPVAGVSVTVEDFREPKSGDLSPWLDGVKQGQPPWVAAKFLDYDRKIPESAHRKTTTDRDGRFRLEGIAAERAVSLGLAGESIAGVSLEVATRAMEPIAAKGFSNPLGPGSRTIFGADFTYTAAPGRPVEGVIKDARTGDPLAGAEVRSYHFAGSDFMGIMTVRTRADDRGRFRLVGMPRGQGNRLIVVPADDQPYLMQEVDVPDAPGVEPIAIEVSLQKGVFIEGTLTEQATGKPVAGVWLHYLPFRDNPFARAHPALGSKATIDGFGFQDRYVSKPDGTFRLVGLPGRAVVGAKAYHKPYVQGAGSESIEGLNQAGHFLTYNNPVLPGQLWPTVMKEINPGADAESVRVDLQLRTGPSVRIRVVDAGGRPVAGAMTYGRGGRGSYDREAMAEAEGEAANLMPVEERSVVVRLDGRKLGKVARVRQGDDAGGPVVVTLEPLATITGRVTDAEGTPARGAEVRADVLPGGDYSISLPSVVTDEHGRFQVPEIPVGAEYLVAVASRGNPSKNRRLAFVKKVVVKAGETTDVGDVAFDKD